MIHRNQIEGRIRHLLSEFLAVDPRIIKDESYLIDDLGADSVDTVEIIMIMEEDFRIEINDEEAEKVATFEQLCLLVEKTVNNG